MKEGIPHGFCSQLVFYCSIWHILPLSCLDVLPSLASWDVTLFRSPFLVSMQALFVSLQNHPSIWGLQVQKLPFSSFSLFRPPVPSLLSFLPSPFSSSSFLSVLFSSLTSPSSSLLFLSFLANVFHICGLNYQVYIQSIPCPWAPSSHVRLLTLTVCHTSNSTQPRLNFRASFTTWPLPAFSNIHLIMQINNLDAIRSTSLSFHL